MKREWGREEYAGDWPSDKAVWTIAAFFVALVSVAAICTYRYERVLTPLQRHYLLTYAGTPTAGVLRKDGWYTLLAVVTRKDSRLAIDPDVEPMTTAAGESTFALTDEAVRTGAVKLEWQRERYDNAKLHTLLAHWIYNDQSLTDLAKPALWGGLGVFVVGLIVAIPKDAARRRERKLGRRLKGPELVTVAEFNRRNRSDGVGFIQQERSVWERVRGQVHSVNIPRAIESSHIEIMGDSGTGKSALIRQILTQAGERGQTAIVYDPALEYTPQFYSPSRGDAILNPLDTRMPYWSPGDELGHDAEALTLAASLFPDRHNDNPFFVEGPRKIFAHLLTFKPSPAGQAGCWTDFGGTEYGTGYAVLTPTILNEPHLQVSKNVPNFAGRLGSRGSPQ